MKVALSADMPTKLVESFSRMPRTEVGFDDAGGARIAEPSVVMALL